MRTHRQPMNKRAKLMATCMERLAKEQGCATEADMRDLGFSDQEIRNLGPQAINQAHRSTAMPYPFDNRVI